MNGLDKDQSLVRFSHILLYFSFCSLRTEGSVRPVCLSHVHLGELLHHDVQFITREQYAALQFVL